MTEIEKQLLTENNELRIRLAENKMLLDMLQYSVAERNMDSNYDHGDDTVLSTIEAGYKTIIEGINEGACILAEDNSIMFYNQKFAKFLGIPLDQILGSNLIKLIPAQDAALVELLLKAGHNGKSKGEIIHNRHARIHKYLFISVVSTPLHLPGKMFILIKDITDIKQNRISNEELLINARLAALNIMEDEVAAKNALAKTNKKLIEEIRQRIKAGDELQQNKLNLLQAQKLAHIGNWSYDLLSQQLSGSEEISFIMGFDPMILKSDYKELKRLITPEDWLRISDAVGIAINKGVIQELELHAHRTNGEDCIIILICTPQLNDEGKVIKLNGIIQDITESKKSEKELMKMNQLYNVISQINQMIVRNQVRETIFTEACNIIIEYGKFRMAWIGLLDENFETIIPVTWGGEEKGYLNKLNSITVSNLKEEENPTVRAIQDGKLFYCNNISSNSNIAIWKEEALKRNYRSVISLPIFVQNKIIGAFTIYDSEINFFTQTEIDLLYQVTNDISFALEVAETEKKRIAAEKTIQKINAELEQRVIQRTLQLDYTNKELEAFTYSVSHDLRAPLRNINGWAHVLMEEFKENLGENGTKYLERVLSEAGRMGNLIDDLLKLSRATLIEKKKETVDLTKIAQNITHRLLDKTPNQKLELIIQPGLVTVGDARMLEIALTNLLDNAFKFSGKKELARIEFGESVINGKPTYWIRDNGVGFDMANSKNLFGAFQRMHNQSDFPGTGIGLATVQRIIHRHSGDIWVESEIDMGTTFYFTIPEDLI